jgi:hypothetical protein
MRLTQVRVLAALVVVLGVAVIGLMGAAHPAFGRAEGTAGGGGSHYMVVMTEGHNLLVTDNRADKLFFYTIDKDKPIGSPLKLRASVDLTKVGQEEIRITPHNLEKFEKSEKSDK